jgi:hypothetical protein
MEDLPNEWQNLAGIFSPMDDQELHQSDDENADKDLLCQGPDLQTLLNLAPQVGIYKVTLEPRPRA